MVLHAGDGRKSRRAMVCAATAIGLARAEFLLFLLLRMPILILALVGLSFVISLLATAAVRRIAPTIGFVDKPGHRKIHRISKPLGGGIAIFVAIAIPLVLGLLFVRFSDPPGFVLNMTDALTHKTSSWQANPLDVHW